MTILTFVGYYVPACKAGGPIRSIANLVEALGREFRFRIITADRDHGDTRPFDGVTHDTWMRVGKAEVTYLSPGERNLSTIAGLMRTTPHDLLYLNSYHSPQFTIQPLALRRSRQVPVMPTLVAPRGEFGRGAYGIRPTKKRLYRIAATVARLYSGITWQASSAAEAEDIRREVGSDARLHVGPDIYVPPLSPLDRTSPKVLGSAYAVVVCRISPVKNLHLLGTMLRRIRGDLTLDIYGIIDDTAYWAKCQSAFVCLPSNVTVTYRGPIEHSMVADILAQSDLFVLPTLGENFCHAAAEAFAAGCPVLISDQTPWRSLEEAQAGWDLPLDRPGAFAEAIQRIVDMDEDEHLEWREGARSYITDHPLIAGAVEANRQMLLSLLNS